MVFDTTQPGTIMTLMDEFGHCNLDIVAGRRMRSREVVPALQASVALHGPLLLRRCDNSSGSAANEL